MSFLRSRLIPLLFLYAIEAAARQPGTVERAVTIDVMEIARRASTPPSVRIVRPRLRLPVLNPQNSVVNPAAPRAMAEPAASPSSAASIVAGFAAEIDNGTATPPDTTGAVGPQHIMTTLNQDVSFQTRSGSVIAAMPLEQFWAAAGPIRQFATDPHVAYDRAADRWIACVLADPDQSTAALLVGASATGDPTGKWSLYRIPLALASRTLTGDYPLLGFNNNWVVVSLDIFRSSNFDHSNIYLFTKSDLYSGAAATPHFTMYTDTGFTFLPVVDFDNAPNRLYLVQNESGATGTLRVSQIQGPVGSETFIPGSGTVALAATWADDSPSQNGDFAPQLGSTATIDTGDSRMQSCMLRNGSIWCAHKVFLPARRPTRSAVQWVKFDPATYQVQQLGRIDDPTATTFYAYPAIAVNKNNDALIGYTRFSATQYPSANFSFRAATDPPSTLQADTVIKAGESFYRLAGRGTQDNRWGDFSTTVVDPADDLTFWTIQEYAASPAADNTPRWGTWWAEISPQSGATATPVISQANILNGASFRGGPIAPGEIVTIRGSNIGPAGIVSGALPYGPLVARTRVLFNGIPAPVIYASSGQTTAVVPFALAGASSVQVQVEYLGVTSNAVTVPVASTAPGLFTADESGSGAGAIRNENASVNSPANPAAPNSVILLFGTGGGQTNPPGVDGQAAQLAGTLQAGVTVQIGGMQAEVQYSGPAPEVVNGGLQINARIPAGVTGNATVIATVGGVASQPVTVAVGR